MKSKEFFVEILKSVDVRIGGDRPWDIKVHNEKLYDRVLSKGTLGLGEAYMDGWWDAPELDQFFYKVISGGLQYKIKFNLANILAYLKSVFINLQNKSRAFDVAKKHYDLDNDLYTRMIGKTMAYTCGYWKNVKTLDDAQIAKMDLICKKIGLKPGMKVLDIGCGWGSFMKYAAEKYGVSCVGLTISQEQIKLGQEFCKGLPIEFKFTDYRDFSGEFDRVVSIGMFEAVGYKNYRVFMECVEKLLKNDGLFLLHTVGESRSMRMGNPWVTKYIFPNGMSPSLKQVAQATEGLFITEDVHNFGQYYDPTLIAWFNNFNNNWHVLKNRYDERFYRMWKYYILQFAGVFRARYGQLYQFVFSKNGVLGGYESIR